MKSITLHFCSLYWSSDQRSKLFYFNTLFGRHILVFNELSCCWLMLALTLKGYKLCKPLMLPPCPIKLNFSLLLLLMLLLLGPILTVRWSSIRSSLANITAIFGQLLGSPESLLLFKADFYGSFKCEVLLQEQLFPHVSVGNIAAQNDHRDPVVYTLELVGGVGADAGGAAGGFALTSVLVGPKGCNLGTVVQLYWNSG